MTLVAIDKVTIGSNRRPLKDHKVAELMESIQANGLLNPITLDQNLTLIAGLHRLTACKLLGLTQIECRVVNYTDADQARLAEIDENLIRNELEALERSELWLERDQILERMGLRARPGDNQYTLRGGEPNSPPVKTTVELAREAGYTDRTFQQGKQIARDIAPEVKKVLRGTPTAKSPKALLTVARAGSEERKRAEQAEQAMRAAESEQHAIEVERQAKIAAEARAKQTDLQLVALYSTEAQKVARQATKKSQRKAVDGKAVAAPISFPGSQPGDEWLLERHLVYCGDTTGQEFLDCLPSDAALAIATPHALWQHDYLVQEARTVAVVCSEGNIHQLCHHHRMPFQFEFLVGKLYIAMFSEKPLLKPEHIIDLDGIQGIEGVVTYLISLYTRPGHFVINTGVGEGEVLIACERLGRTCFAGDERPEHIDRAIARWQKWTGKQAEKLD
jgi:ParB family transcriptional regulator, chromosome partitioning protein